MIDCREAVRRMWAYLDHALEPGPLEEFETHLEVCQRCCGELEFSRHLKERVTATGSEANATQRARVRAAASISFFFSPTHFE